MLLDDLLSTGKRFYCVYFSLRSGSTLLCQDLEHWGFGSPAECFQSPLYADHRARRTVSDYVLRLVNDCPHNTFGFKIAWGQACVLAQSLREEGVGSGGVDLSSAFPNLYSLRISRRDRIRQAVSVWRAAGSGTWHWPKGDPRPIGGPEYDFDELYQVLQRLLLEDMLWDEHFRRHDIVPFSIEYESYVSDRSQAMANVASFLGLTPDTHAIPDHLQPMADDWTDRIVERFWRDANNLVDTEHPSQPALEYADR